MAIRVPANGGTPRVYRLPALREAMGAIRGALPAVERAIGLDPEAEYLYAETRDNKILALDLGSASVDTVAAAI